MKRLLPLLIPGFVFPAQAHDSDIPYGIEVVAGYRSDYVYRGFSLADDLIEFQLGTEIALSDEWLLDLGAWFGTGSRDFEEIAASFGIRYDQDDWDAGLTVGWHGYQHSLFRDGVEVGPFFNWYPNDDWRVGTSVSYDGGPDGWYGNLEAEWTQVTGNNSFISILGGVSALSHYYGRGGMNDLFARFGWTYGFNRSVAVTPFVGTSLPLDSDGSTRLFGGLWFEVNF